MNLSTVKNILPSIDYPVLSEWVKGASFIDIGKSLGVTKQSIKTRFDMEIDSIYNEVSSFLNPLLYDSRTGEMFPFYDFSPVGNMGIVFAHLLKKHYGYHVFRKSGCSKEKLNASTLRACVIREIKSEGLPVSIKKPSLFGVSSEVSFGATKLNESFIVLDKKLILRRNHSPIYNVCSYLKRNEDINIERTFLSFPPSYLSSFGFGGFEDFLLDVKMKKYHYVGRCRKIILRRVKK